MEFRSLHILWVWWFVVMYVDKRNTLGKWRSWIHRMVSISDQTKKPQASPTVLCWKELTYGFYIRIIRLSTIITLLAITAIVKHRFISLQKRWFRNGRPLVSVLLLLPAGSPLCKDGTGGNLVTFSFMLTSLEPTFRYLCPCMHWPPKAWTDF